MRTVAATLTLVALLATAAHAEDGNWMVRGRVINVAPSNNGGDASIGGKPHADNSFAPEVDVTYFATPNIGFEVIAATTKHDTKVNKKPTETDLGSVWVLPPTLTAQYHVTEACLGNFKPYVGAGVTYAHFYNAEHRNAPGINSVKYDDAFGPALQAGVDYKISDNMYLNADVKKLYISTDVKVNDTITAKANLQPWVMGVGVGYRF
ncbi:MAG: OmpW family outer membrane protein [Alphaproteobacteria bacterium]